jgi:SAM-dependent methyltransferase
MSSLPKTTARENEPRRADPRADPRADQPDLALNRRNMLCPRSEAWRPPPFVHQDGILSPIVKIIRRLLDLQAGSIWRDLSKLLPLVNGSVLDVGCGGQPYRSLFSRAVTYTGIDTVDAAANFGYQTPDTLYFSGNTWPVEDASVDFVLCTETLEHVPDPTVLIAEAFRCLVPGGTFLLTVPFAARWHFTPHDYWRYTPSGMDRLLSLGGFVNCQVHARGNAGTVACYKVMALLLRMGMPQNRSLLVRMSLRFLFLPFAPLMLALVVVANISMSGHDCLGYTVLAEKRSL